MIPYNRSAFGLNLVLKIHGSAVYRAILPSLFSVGIFLLLRFYYSNDRSGFTRETGFGEDLGHPYAIGALVASASFLVVFRANQGYARYWEAASATHHMMSKWMDATVHTCVYHMQCDHYDKIKPPTYYEHPELNHLYLTRDRERGVDYTNDEVYKDHQDDHPKDNDVFEPKLRLRRSASKRRASSFAVAFGLSDKAALQQERVKRQLRAVHKSINAVVPTIPSRVTSERSRSGPASLLDTGASFRVSASSTLHKIQRPLLRRNHSLPAISSHGASTRSADALADDHDDDPLPKPEFPRQFSSTRFFANMKQDGRVSRNAPGTGKPFPLWGKPRWDGNWSEYYTDSSRGGSSKRPTRLSTFVDPRRGPHAGSEGDPLPAEGFASTKGGRTPPLFLQELAHLASLATAVALATLRNDIEDAESPLARYEAGAEWPTVDPDKDEWIKISGMGKYQRFLWSFFGMATSPEEQTRYNAGRPLPVIGGVSDAEIRFLQMAKGPYAKTQLCWNWLSEFIIREHLAGSLGEVGPPIISRIIQFLGDGMIFYNHARKIMFIPFPFVHAQLSVIFVLVLIPVIPFLMEQYTEEAWLGCILTFFTVMSLAGINEVARELENPFRNVPNELPLVTMMAQFNEALITMYSGYHPDHYWDGKRVLQRRGHGCSIPRDLAEEDSLGETTDDEYCCDDEDEEDEFEQDHGPGSRFFPTGTGQHGEAPLQAVTPSPTKPLVVTTTTAHEKEALSRTVSTSASTTTKSSASSAAGEATTKKKNHSKESSDEEVARLRRQLEKQAALIEELFRRVESDPARATHQLDELVSTC